MSVSIGSTDGGAVVNVISHCVVCLLVAKLHYREQNNRTWKCVFKRNILILKQGKMPQGMRFLIGLSSLKFSNQQE